MSHQQLNGGGESTANVMSSMLGLMNTAKEKWDSSGASAAMGRVTASIPDSTKSYVGTLFQREHLRSVSVFFGIGEERSFYVEKTPSLLTARLRHNITFFYLNYILLTFVLFCLTMITSPLPLIGMGLLALVWMWVIRASQSGTLVISGVSIPQKTAMLVLGGVSLFVVFWLLKSVFWWTLFSSGFLVGIHALFRDASMHKDMEDVVAMEGDLGLHEDAAFLNANPV